MERRPPRRWQRSEHNTHKEMNQWHASLSTTTESSPDPDPEMSVDQVKATLSDFYGEIANASVKETKRGEDTIYEFQRRVGTKGSPPFDARS